MRCSRLIAVVMLLLLAGAGNMAAQTSARPRNRSQAAALVRQGAEALERGDEAAAATAFREALRLSPRNADAHTYLGVLADRADDLDAAERHFAAAVASRPGSPATRNNYGALLVRRGRPKQAASEFEASLRLDPKQVSALVNLAQIRAAEGTEPSLRQARLLFERARAVAPDADIARALVLLAIRTNDRAAAERYYREYAAAVAQSSATPASRAELGATLAAAGMVDQAIAELNAVVSADPSHVDAHVLLARAYAAKGDVKSAGATLEGAVARGLTAAPIYAELAAIYEQVEHLENAINALRAAIDADPQNESYRFRYGMLLIRAKAPGAAVIRLREAVAEFPQSAHLWFALGLAHFSDHKNDDAAAAFDQAIKIQPDFAPALAYRGMVHVAVGKYEEAVALYERALAANESLAVAHYLLGDALLKAASPDTARAERHLTQAVRLDGSLVLARLALGKHLLASNRFEQAAAELEKAIELEPNLPEAHYQLGRAYARLKRKEDSQKAFARFEELGKLQREQAVSERQELVRRLAKVHF